ncbi:hypothetical protein Acsp02_96050 [Actinoplanes sp. NBRC 103695]|nr:hypothetical protein Acsp02_96050 [Actinoplanes sp. NBRC 103695]
MVDDQQRVRQDLPDRGLEDHAHVDCYRVHLLTPRQWALLKPAGDRCRAPAFDLCQQINARGNVVPDVSDSLVARMMLAFLASGTGLNTGPAFDVDGRMEFN